MKLTKMTLISVTIFAIILLLYFGSYFYLTGKILSVNENVSDFEIRGQFGDMFGAVNALFSGLAFAGIIITILLQKQELKLQRNELSLTREELALTRKEFKNQNQTLVLQRFENTFFNMVAIHQDILRTTTHIISKDLKGIDAMSQFVVDFKSTLKETEIKFNKNLMHVYRGKFYEYFQKISRNISPYLQSLISIHTVINNSDLDQLEKQRYFDIMGSYISINEKIFFFYHLALKIPNSDDRTLDNLFVDFRLNYIDLEYLIHASHAQMAEYRHDRGPLIG